MKSILLVEDNPDNRDLVDAFIGHLYTITAVEDGAAAIAYLEGQSNLPDIFLFDISLPQMDGVELLRYVREMPACQAIPVVALTSHAMKGDRERFLAAGFEGYVSKPISDDAVLLAAIETAISNG